MNHIDESKIGYLIRIHYEDYNLIRQWLSFFIQEVCRVIEGYEDVWTDYLLSTGIVLPDLSINLKTKDGKNIKIPLQEGVNLIGIYEDEKKDEGVNKKNQSTYQFQLDIGKLMAQKSKP